jgi:hypothetical protein
MAIRREGSFFMLAPRHHARYVRRMIRHCMLFAGIMCLSLAALAQQTQWKAIACTVERPDFARGSADYLLHGHWPSPL